MRTELQHRRPAVAVAVVLALAAACAGGTTDEAGGPSADHRLSVVTTVAPITSIVAGVAGDLATVTGLVPEGTNSHTFEPPPSAAKVLSEADVVFVNGLKLEEPTAGLARELAKEGSEIVELGERTVTPAEYIYDFSFPQEGGKPNPHLWTNPPMARQFARVVADTLKRRDPADAAAYEANFERFAAKVDELDGAMKAATATLSPERRKLLTYHDAYAYFARHYGWTVVGAVQPSNFEEPTPKDVAALIDQVRREGVPAIFGSEVFPSPVLEQIGRETGVRYVDVLRDDDLPGKPGEVEHSWLGLMRFDFVTMVEALGGDASALRALDVASPVPDRATYPQ
ncbi:MAG TPA: metal ABC transporter substrate-binding protein [Acidimicrobiales bacterium]|nr:metal ABC transporter substrate-binding protein [Acidimicrobiales bacterium]